VGEHEHEGGLDCGHPECAQQRADVDRLEAMAKALPEDIEADDVPSEIWELAAKVVSKKHEGMGLDGVTPEMMREMFRAYKARSPESPCQVALLGAMAKQALEGMSEREKFERVMRAISKTLEMVLGEGTDVEVKQVKGLGDIERVLGQAGLGGAPLRRTADMPMAPHFDHRKYWVAELAHPVVRERYQKVIAFARSVKPSIPEVPRPIDLSGLKVPFSRKGEHDQLWGAIDEALTKFHPALKKLAQGGQPLWEDSRQGGIAVFVDTEDHQTYVMYAEGTGRGEFRGTTEDPRPEAWQGRDWAEVKRGYLPHPEHVAGMGMAAEPLPMGGLTSEDLDALLRGPWQTPPDA
jgi:hypothetical protein